MQANPHLPHKLSAPSTQVVAEEALADTYAQRHYERAQRYLDKGDYALAIQELRDAIRIRTGKSDYYALLGKTYLQQNMLGMANTYLRQAVKLNPNDKVALECLAKLATKETQKNQSPKNQVQKASPTTTKKRFFGLFGQ